jgi:sugar lactone lactonase YvrE
MRAIPHYRATLGEGPLWVAEQQALYWIDIHQDNLIRYRPALDRSEVRKLPHRPTSLCVRSDGLLLVSYKAGLGTIDFEAGRAQDLPVSGVDFGREAFNDSACDRLGRLWIGTRDPQPVAAAPVGRLYRMQGDLAAVCVDDGFVISNGRAWSPDGRTMYHTDSVPGRIDAYDFDLESGALSNRRVFVDYAGKGCRPDGCTVDAEGGLWVAEVEGWRVARYRPDGSLDRQVALPFRKPSSVMFGGPGLGTLYVTSVTAGLTPQELEEQPLAGMLVALELGVAGLPEGRFACA